MVLVLVILTLAFQGSWQQVSTEKTLNEIIDQLIEETAISPFSNENKNSHNNSRIIYIKSDNTTKRAKELRLNSVPSSEYEDLENLVHHIKSSKYDIAYPKPDSGEKVVREITVEIERNAEPYGDNSGGRIEEIEIVNDGFSKSGKPLFEDIPDNTIVRYTSESESNLIHNYPEIIIDKITYDSNENQIKEKEKSEAVQNIEPTNVNHFEKRKEVAAKALGSLMKLLIKEPPIKNSLDSNEVGLHAKDEINTILKATHIHNDYHNQVINNVPLAYGGIPSGNMLLGKLPEGYRDLHRIINRPRSAYLDPNMQLSRWRGNVGQNTLMSISRAHNLNRVHFIPKPLNIVSRFVYQPLFRHPQFLK